MNFIKYCVFIILSIVSLANHANAQPTDTLELSGFIDGIMSSYMADKNIAGGAVAIVKNGNPFFLQGYGFADTEQQVSVDPEKTLFRIGSISKLFTWISVMQLVEKGMLDLDKDINHYLKKVRVPEKFEKPITLRHLMTHTPGFEDRLINLFAKGKEGIIPLADILVNEMPERIWPPGEVTSYSNHGTGLAALVVEEISGQNWIEFFESNIRIPLQLEQLSFDQPLPSPLSKNMSKGYMPGNGELREQPFEFIPLAPVGAASASAETMARFMIACLNYGKIDTVKVLDSLQMARMFQVNHQNAEGFNGAGLGFFEMDDHGQRIVGHGGDTFWFHSLLALYPDHDLGIFISLNSQGGNPSELLKIFNEHYFPYKAVTNRMDLSKEQSMRFQGSYRSVRYPHTRITKISALMSVMNVEVLKDGTLRTTGQKVRYWIPIDSMTFLEKNGTDKIGFKADDEGNITNMYINSLPYFAFEKVPIWATPSLHAMILIFYLVMAGITLIHWPLSYINRKEYIPKNRSVTLLPMRPKLAVWMASSLTIFFFIGIGWVFRNPVEIVYGVPSLLKWILIIPFLIAALVTVGIIYLPHVILGKGYKKTGKVHLLLSIFAQLLFLWQCYYWNMLGFHY